MEYILFLKYGYFLNKKFTVAALFQDQQYCCYGWITSSKYVDVNLQLNSIITNSVITNFWS